MVTYHKKAPSECQGQGCQFPGALEQSITLSLFIRIAIVEPIEKSTNIRMDTR